MNTEKLQKVLARAGVASRRSSEKLISAGRVKVNGVTTTKLGVRVNANIDEILVDGVSINSKKTNIYILLNKPTGVITSVSDPQNRKTVIDLINFQERLYPVGRLDYNTSGALILTNDGDTTYNLTHPSKGVWKKYIVTIKGDITKQQIELLKHGIKLDDGLTAPAKCKLISCSKRVSTIEISIHEGRNRQIRRMFKSLDKIIVTLHRIEFGPIKLNDLPIGKWRYLTNAEIKQITYL